MDQEGRWWEISCPNQPCPENAREIIHLCWWSLKVGEEKTSVYEAVPWATALELAAKADFLECFWLLDKVIASQSFSKSSLEREARPVGWCTGSFPITQQRTLQQSVRWCLKEEEQKCYWGGIVCSAEDVTLALLFLLCAREVLYH